MQLGMNIKSSNSTDKKIGKESTPHQEFNSFEDLDNAMTNAADDKSAAEIFPNKTAVIASGIIAVIIVIVMIVLAVAKKGKADQESIDTGYTTENITGTVQEAGDVINDAETQAYLELQPSETPTNTVYDEDGNIISDREDIINPGVNEFDTEGGTTTAKVYSANDFIKDLNGVDISAVYNVKSFSYLTDYVNYEKRRAIMDDGMELYWLDITYHNKKYRCTVPFYIFKSLDSSGITRVKLELLTLDNGEKVISYMRVAEEGEE